MPYARAKKYSKKIYNKAIKPYTSKRKGRQNRMKLYKEVAAIKKMINAEKKYIDGSLAGRYVGQAYNAAEGAFNESIVPTITQGTANNNRVGNSIKLSGLYIRAKFYQQTNTINRVQLRVTIVRALGAPQTPGNILTGLYDADSISTYRDYYAPRNPNQFSDYKILGTRRLTLQPDSITGQLGIVNLMFPMKLNFHMRWDNSGTLQEGGIFAIIQADNGDSGTANTGVWFEMTTRLSYYDN